MVVDINTVTVTGRLTKDGELRYTPNGNPVMNISIASNRVRKNQSTGEYEEAANFFDATILGRKAESLAQYLQKGVRVAIDGELRYQSWEKDGQKRSKVEIIVDRLVFMSKNQQAQPAQQPAPQPQQYQQAPQFSEPQYYEQDLAW